MAADPNYHPEEFQKVLRAWMDRNGYSQMAAAQVIGVSQGIINRWLKPYGSEYLVQPTIDTLTRLAEHMPGVTLMELRKLTNNLSPAEASRLPPPRDHRTAALVEELNANFASLDESTRSLIESFVRSAIDLHHNRTRKPRPHGTSKGGSQSEGDSTWPRQLMPVLVH